MCKFRNIEEAREFFRAERFAIENGCMIEELESGRSVCSISLSDKHKNSSGLLMGGVVFTIANFAYSVAAYNDYGSEEPATVSINYLSTPKGDRLVAYAECADTTPRKIAESLKRNWNISGMKAIGNMDAKVNKIMVCGHVSEGGDSNSLINRVDKENINLLIPLELIDFTLSEYIKDSGQLGYDKAILAPGHFNVEEPGMKYMVNWIDEALKQHIETTFVQAGDMYTYL